MGTKLSGVNRHQDYNFVGNALPNSGQWRDVKLLREGGCNVIRAAHYPMDPRVLRRLRRARHAGHHGHAGLAVLQREGPRFSKSG
ncbi:MAG: glycoside hydrolase family 2 TIM barrel-domain containing protein [Verrucomicrobiota bacterium]